MGVSSVGVCLFFLLVEVMLFVTFLFVVFVLLKDHDSTFISILVFQSFNSFELLFLKRRTSVKILVNHLQHKEKKCILQYS